MTLALIALSLVPLTGWAGQVNFAPLAFAGFGAFVFLKFSGGDGSGDTEAVEMEQHRHACGDRPEIGTARARAARKRARPT